MKRFFTLLMALYLFAIAPITAFATKVEATPVASSNVVRDKTTVTSTREMTYNQVWIDAGKYAIGSFTIKNLHTFLFTTTNGTVTVQSDNPNAEVHIIVHDGLHPIYDGTVRPSSGEVTFSSQSNSSEYVVNYYVYSTNKKDGIRVNCWLY